MLHHEKPRNLSGEGQERLDRSRARTEMPDPAATRDAGSRDHTVRVVRTGRVIRVAGLVHDEFTPGRPRLRKQMPRDPGTSLYTEATG